MMEVPKGLRLHIAFFGNRNVGKSSLLNALAGQNVAIVSDTPGTTTDPVEKTLEIARLGPVVLLDTAGVDDEGALGEQRVERTLQVMRRVDMALLVTDGAGWGEHEAWLAGHLHKLGIPFAVLLGEDEINAGKCSVKDMRSGEQQLLTPPEAARPAWILPSLLSVFPRAAGRDSMNCAM